MTFDRNPGIKKTYVPNDLYGYNLKISNYTSEATQKALPLKSTSGDKTFKFAVYPSGTPYIINAEDNKVAWSPPSLDNVVRNGDKYIALLSSTPDSTKGFKITVDDSGTINATEVM